MLPRSLKIIALVYAAYVGLSILVVMPLLNYLVPKVVSEQLQRPLTTELIVFNPFNLGLEVRKAELGETDGTPFAGFRLFEVNLSLASLVRKGWVLDKFTVDELTVHVKRLPGNVFNFSDMMGNSDTPDAEPELEPQPDAPAELPGITIKDFNFHAQRILVTDTNRVKPYQTHWDNLAIRVRDLSTVREEGKPYRISASAEQGGTLTWEGDISIPQARSEGRLALSNVRLRTAWRFMEPWLNFELRHGRLDVEGTYDLSWDQEFSYLINDGALTIRGIDIVPQDQADLPDTGITLDNISLTGVSVDGANTRVDLDGFSIHDLAVSGFMDDARISLAELFATRFEESPESETPVAEEESGSPWQVNLKTFQISESSVNWRSPYTSPDTLVVAPISARWENIAWPLAGQSSGELALAILDTATFTLAGNIDLGSGSGNIDYKLSQLPVPWFNPNLPSVLNADIIDGEVNMQGGVQLAGFTPTTATLDGAIQRLEISIQEEETSLSGWEDLRLDGLKVDIPAQVLALDAVHLEGYTGRLHIKEDGTINTQRLLEEEAEAREAENPEPQQTDEETEPWRAKIGVIHIEDGQLDFMDESLPIQFRTIIGQITGEIMGLDTSPGSRMEVDLDGSVDGYAPVRFAGAASPFDEYPMIDLSLSFDGVDMARLTPYSGAYAGYAIDRGLLSLDVKYGLDKGQLQGDNNILIDQLKLGDKIESEQAVDLPLELALALLTDANGVIDLALPVSGDVNDPEFSIGGIVGKAMVNLITSAVTAPFKLLAGLVSSDEDLQSVIFPSGLATLDEAGKAKLASLTQAMQQRPELTLIIKGRLHPTADQHYLQQQALNQALITEGISSEEIKAKSPRYLSAIETRYRALVPEMEEELPSLRSQLEQVTATMTIADSQLELLADDRAAETKRYLVNDLGLPADRSVIEQADITEEANRFSGVEMDLDT